MSALLGTTVLGRTGLVISSELPSAALGRESETTTAGTGWRIELGEKSAPICS